MIVNQRRGDVAVMRTLGSGSGTITSAFVVWVCDRLGGESVSVWQRHCASLVVQDAFAWVERTFAVNVMNQYFVTYLPSELRLADVVRVVVVALTLCVLSTRYPHCALPHCGPPTCCAMSESAIECRGVAKAFREGAALLPVLKGVDLSVAPGANVSASSAGQGRERARCCTFWAALRTPMEGEVRLQAHRLPVCVPVLVRSCVTDHSASFMAASSAAGVHGARKRRHATARSRRQGPLNEQRKCWLPSVVGAHDTSPRRIVRRRTGSESPLLARSFPIRPSCSGERPAISWKAQIRCSR